MDDAIVMRRVATIAAFHYTFLHHANFIKPIERALYRGTATVELICHLHLAAAAPAFCVGEAAQKT
ncbi:MAG: hypothetical protein DI528_20245 [Shinella sp.]|nr:MAG: hypothetical protein DI528_20245 [Shinella sp.]